MSICIIREMSFDARETQLSQCLNGAFVICQFWCTSISPCQNAKIRKLFIYGFGTCSVINFSPGVKSFRFALKRFGNSNFLYLIKGNVVSWIFQIEFFAC